MMIPKGHNPKGLALIIRGLIHLYRLENSRKYLEDARRLAEIIISQRARDRDYFCVGYDFFWQAKAFTVPEFTPNMIVSTFAGQALMDLYEIDGDDEWLRYVLEIGEFIEKELKLLETDEEIAFGYIPGERVIVHNANLMGSGFFARLFTHAENSLYRGYAIKSAQYSVNAQRGDGAWVYGEKEHFQWVDNFHTGFNLVSLNAVQQFLGMDRWESNIKSGLEYHLEHHFLDDMTPKYYDRKLYPLDIHNFAQGIDTMLTFGYSDKAEQLLRRCIDQFWDEKENYFYYQKTKLYTNRINYIRWSQAWMFYALTKYFLLNNNR